MYKNSKEKLMRDNRTPTDFCGEANNKQLFLVYFF